jgi:hypothetical protein
MGYRKRTVRSTGEITDEITENMPEAETETEGTVRLARTEVVAEISEPNVEEVEAAELKRKMEIAEKRRASLALARSKIIPKSQLKKQVADATKVVEEVSKSKDEVIRNKQEETDAMRLKYERERVKQLEDSLMTLQKLIVDRPTPAPAPIVEPEKPKYKRPSRAKSAVAERVVVDKPSQSGSPYGTKHDVPSRPERTTQPQQIIPKKSVEPRITRPATTETLIDKSYSEQLQERLRSQAINRIMSDTFGGF